MTDDLEALSGEIARLLGEWLDGHCDSCHKPPATDADWRDIPEGEGEHLCWGTPICGWGCDVPIAAHLADALADLLAARERGVRAEALREAADEARRIHGIARTPMNELDEATKDEFRHHPLAEVSGIQPHRITVADWLSGRADRIEATP